MKLSLGVHENLLVSMTTVIWHIVRRDQGSAVVHKFVWVGIWVGAWGLGSSVMGEKSGDKSAEGICKFSHEWSLSIMSQFLELAPASTH